MERAYFIGMDVHKQTTEIAVTTKGGRLSRRERCQTAIPELRAILERTRRPRYAVLEEGPLADWLLQNLEGSVDELMICDPRRNNLIAKDSDKDDPIDAEKLAQLYRGGFVKPVHHADSRERMLFKERVALYHDRVRNRVRQANRIISQFSRHGVMLTETGFANAVERATALRQLPRGAMVREDFEVLLLGYDVAVEQEDRLRGALTRVARKNETIRRFTAIPGVKWIRASTFYAYVDTPWRFKSKSALWKYLGIGLERRTSGQGPVKLRVARNANRCLKNMILGAAKTAAIKKDGNPFGEQYRRYIDEGLTPKNARRSVARSQAATMWGMWKNGDAYRPELVGPILRSEEMNEGHDRSLHLRGRRSSPGGIGPVR